MTIAILWRLIWKEYRQLRAFWILIALVVPLFPLLLVVNAQPESYFGAAMVAPVLFALVCGGVAFAAEHETMAYQFQRSLPLPSVPVVASKVFAAITGIVTITGASLLIAWTLTGGKLPNFHRQHLFFIACAVTTLEMLAWGMFCSLVMKRAFGAVLHALFVQVLAAHVIVPNIITTNFLRDGWRNYEDYNYYAIRFAFGLIVLVLDIWLAKRWFRGLSLIWPEYVHRAWRRLEIVSRKHNADQRKHAAAFACLVWQGWRQSAPTIAISTFCYVVLAIPNALFFEDPSVGTYATGLVLFVIIVTMAGVNVFSGDRQCHGIRFLAEQGIDPRQVWLSRHVVWLPVCFCWLILAVVFLALDTGWRFNGFPTSIICTLGLAATGYSVGQFFSVLAKREVMATVLSCSALLPISKLVLDATFQNGELVIPICFLAPIPILLMWVTWRFAPHWIIDRKSLELLICAAVLILVPLGLLLGIFLVSEWFL